MILDLKNKYKCAKLISENERTKFEKILVDAVDNHEIVFCNDFTNQAYYSELGKMYDDTEKFIDRLDKANVDTKNSKLKFKENITNG